MPRLDELDDAAFDKAQAGREARLGALEKADYERWDMTTEGDERFRSRKTGLIVTLKYDPDTCGYRVTPETY